MARYADLTGYSPEENRIWEQICASEGQPFHTARGLLFSFRVRGNELFVDRREKSLTRSTVILCFRRATEILSAGKCIRSPKNLGTFGASYLLPIFQGLNLLCQANQQGKTLPSHTEKPYQPLLNFAAEM